MFKKYCLYAFLFWLSSHVSHAQTIAGLTVNIENKEELLSAPVSVNLDNITSKIDSSLSLQFSDNGQWKEIPMQITHGQTRAMHWILSSNQKKSNATLKYRLVDKHPGTFNLIKSTDNDGIHTIEFDNKKLLSYYYRTLYPPEGVDSSFKRSGFIHPLYSPRGQVLTRIQPPDHYHHYGIWNPWTHVLYKGDTIDFWNLNKRQGTVRFAKFVSKTDGPVYSQFKALHEHVVFDNNMSEEVALNELQSVTVYQPEGENYFIVDLDMQMNCASDNPFTILEYRYEGLGWRTTEEWDNKNSEVISSTGKDRVHTDGSKERWCIIQGKLGNDYGGVVMMSHPANYNHPEPMRIWPINQYGRGDMFASFSTTKDMDWPLKPKNTYQLKYRLMVYNGHFTPEMAESAWLDFAYSPEIILEIE